MPGMVSAKALREKRANLGTQANQILVDAGKENRDLTAEEQQTFDNIHAEIETLRVQVEKIEKHERLMAELNESRGRQTVEDSHSDPQPKNEAEQRANAAFNAYLRYGAEGMDAEQRSALRFVRDTESRAAQTVTTTGGGYLIPQGFVAELEKSMKAFGGVEQACDVFSTETGNTLPWPTYDDTSNTGRLLAINTTVTNTAVTYGQTSFAAYKFSSDSVLVPVELLQDSAFDLNAHLAAVLGERLGRVHNTYETTGTGSSQPQGIVVGSSSALTAAGTSAVTTDELLDLVHAIDPAYRVKGGSFGAGWMFNDTTFKILRQLKDADSRPLWGPGIGGGAPDTLWDFPYTINQDMDAMTTGLKPILFGALKKFKVRKVKDITILRLVERYADAHQVGYLAFTRMDSKVLDAGTDPIKYITMA